MCLIILRSLGVIELTVALNFVFDQPEDRIIWDVGHQAYPHKMLTGRRERMSTIRQTDGEFTCGERVSFLKQLLQKKKKLVYFYPAGLSPFTKRSESPFDCFGAGHSSTSISAGLGMAVARDMQGKSNHVIAVIGDGAITGGMAYEAMNNAGYLDTNMIIILNDNQQVSLPTQYNSLNQDPVGALSSTFARLQSSKPLRELRESAKAITKQMPVPVQEVTAKVDEYARGMISGSGSTLFEELGCVGTCPRRALRPQRLHPPRFLFLAHISRQDTTRHNTTQNDHALFDLFALLFWSLFFFTTIVDIIIHLL